MRRSVLIFVNADLCKGADGCGICVGLCPEDVFGIADRLTVRGIRPPVVHQIDACTNCGNCMLYCPDMAIVVEPTEPEQA